MIQYHHPQTPVAVGTPHVLVVPFEALTGEASGQLCRILNAIQGDFYNPMDSRLALLETPSEIVLSLPAADNHLPSNMSAMDDILGREELIPIPASRATGVMRAKLVFGGRVEPLPFLSPWDY